jgi:WD40 repeat protein
MSDIFISYARSDKPTAEALAAYLKSQHLDVWWDAELYAGDDFHDRILEEIGKAKAVIVIWSDAAVASRWVRGEASLADESDKLIMTHVPGFDTHRIPINFRALHCESVEARKRISAALESRGVLPDAVRAEADDRLWMQVRDTRNIDALRLYQWKFPNGRHAEEVDLELRRLLSGETAAPATARGQASLLIRLIEAHESTIRSVALTPDGALAVTASDDGSAKLWETVSGRLVAALRGHTSSVMAVAVAPDGWRAITGSTDRTAKIWDLEGGRLQSTLVGHSWGVAGVAFSPDGALAVTGGDDYAIKVWDVASGALKRTVPKRSLWSRAGHGGTVPAITFAERGRWMITGSGDGTVKVWAMPYCEAVCTLKGHSDAVTALAVSPDDSRVISASLDNTVRTWSIGDWKSGAIFETNGGGVCALAAMPNLWGVVAACRDGTLKILDVAGAEMIGQSVRKAVTTASFTEHACTIRAVALSLDGRRAVSGDDHGKLAVWDFSEFARA